MPTNRRPLDAIASIRPQDQPPPILVQLGRTAIPALLLLLTARMDREASDVDPGLQGAVDSLRALQAGLFDERSAATPDPSTLGAILDAVETIRSWIA